MVAAWDRYTIGGSRGIATQLVAAWDRYTIGAGSGITSIVVAAEGSLHNWWQQRDRFNNGGSMGSLHN